MISLKIFYLLIFVAYVKSQSCCPEGAWAALDTDEEYETQGTIETLEVPGERRNGVASVNNMDIYKVGTSDKCIIWNYDIFGLRSGRTLQMADFLAAHGK